MSIFKRGSIWWYEFVFHGQRVRESTGSNSRTLAVRAERQRRRDLEESANGVRPIRRQLLFPSAAREWMNANQARWSSSNIAIQNYNLKHLSAYFGGMLMSDITPQHIGRYQAFRQKQKASNRTINMEVSTLRMILKSAKLWGSLSADVKMLPERSEIGRALSRQEERDLLAACRVSPSRGLYSAVMIFSNTGLRNAELRLARWHQVDLLKATFQVGKSKTAGGEGRVVPLNRAAFAAIKDWRSRWPEAKPNDYIYPSEKLAFTTPEGVALGVMTPYDVNVSKPIGSWRRAWRTAKKQAKVECRMHDLRHSFITKLAETSTPDATIQAISGHLSRKMLDHYSHVRGEAMRKAVGLLDSIQDQAVQ
jgi:integrase